MHPYRISRSIATMRGVIPTFLLAWTIAGCASVPQTECDEILSVDNQGSEESRGFHLKGVRLFDRGKLPASAVAFERAIEVDQSNGSAHNNLGLLLYQQRKLSLAAAEFELAGTLMPEDPIPKNNLGMTLEAAGRGEESLDYYSQAYELSPNKPLYLGNLVRTRIRLGEKDESVFEQLRELLFIETRPDWIEWINDQLALDMNPMLDRGPPPPDLGSKNKNKSPPPTRTERLAPDQLAPNQLAPHQLAPNQLAPNQLAPHQRSEFHPGQGILPKRVEGNESIMIAPPYSSGEIELEEVSPLPRIQPGTVVPGEPL